MIDKTGRLASAAPRGKPDEIIPDLLAKRSPPRHHSDADSLDTDAFLTLPLASSDPVAPGGWSKIDPSLRSG